MSPGVDVSRHSLIIFNVVIAGCRVVGGHKSDAMHSPVALVASAEFTIHAATGRQQPDQSQTSCSAQKQIGPNLVGFSTRICLYSQ